MLFTTTSSGEHTELCSGDDDVDDGVVGDRGDGEDVDDVGDRGDGVDVDGVDVGGGDRVSSGRGWRMGDGSRSTVTCKMLGLFFNNLSIYIE